MNKYTGQAHVTEWIGAYHDGELKGARLQQVAVHLEHCATCQAELEALQGLSGLLQAAPAMMPRTHPRTFAAQVGLRLPRSAPQPAWRKVLKIGWQFAPLGLVMMWAFIQAVSIVTSLVLATNLDEQFAPANNLQISSDLDFMLKNLFYLPGQELLSLQDVFPGHIQLDLIGPILLWLGVNVLLAVLLWCWLASWWVYRKRQQDGNRPNLVE